MQENHLAKWLNNELTDAELAEFKNSEAFATYERIMLATDSIETIDFNVDEALLAIKNQQALKDKKLIQLHPFKKFLRVAAAIAIIITGTYFYMNSLDTSFKTEYAENREVILPDNSKVLLNADSKLSYNKKNWNTDRNINLKGEAFFKVAKGKRFTVVTDAGTVAVLGTQFNVENRNDFFEVTCFEGLVSVTYNEKETKLAAGESFVAINEVITSDKLANVKTPSWVNAESTFKSVPLKFVLEEFQRQHNIIVETKNIDLNQHFTGSFSNKDSKLALQSISTPSRIKFKFEGNKVLFYAQNTE